VIAADEVVVVEGEKDVHTLHKSGIVATTTPGGASNAGNADLSPLAGKTVYVWPDNDDAGRGYAAAIVANLEQVVPPPRVFVVDNADLGLPPGGDVTDYRKQYVDEDDQSFGVSVRAVLAGATGSGPASEVWSNIKAAIDGKRYAVQTPWPALNRLTKALKPGTVTVLCGGGGASKSFMLLQMFIHMWANGENVALYELEDDRATHLARALAQISNCSGITDDEWCAENPHLAKEAYELHKDALDGFGRCMYHSPDNEVELDALSAWVKERAEAGARVIGIDPVTYAKGATGKPWDDDRRFITEIKQVARDYGASIVCVTHPRDGTSGRGKVAQDNLAGGRAWSRFTQNVLWLHLHKPEIKVTAIEAIAGTNFRREITCDRSIDLLKTRFARGQGLSIAYMFRRDNLTFDELGVIVDGEE